MYNQDLFAGEGAFAAKFVEYHNKNPHIFDEYCRLTNQAIERGHKHIGSQMILEVMRWKTRVSGDDEFKINNNFGAYYSRMFEAKYPQHKGFFRKRALRG